MGHRGYIPDRGYLQTKPLKRADRGIPSRARTIDPYLNPLQAHILSLAPRLLRHYLGGKGSALSRPLESNSTTTGPGNNLTIGIGDSNNRIIKRGLNMSHSRDYGTADLFLLTCLFLYFSHYKLAPEVHPDIIGGFYFIHLFRGFSRNS